MRTEALLVLLLATTSACRGLDAGTEIIEPGPREGVVVSGHPLASDVGAQVLAYGGNAADAAVATALALAVVYPWAGNLGGGGFALWVPASGELDSIDFREVAPMASSSALYLDAEGAVVAERSLAMPLAVGVPGTPAGLYELYSSYGSGRLTFAALCEPAIQLATEGFEVDAWLARDLLANQLLRKDPASRALFYPGGVALAEGRLLQQPALAETLSLLAREGPAGFYRGPVAEAIVTTLEQADRRLNGELGEGRITLEDLAQYRIKHRKPLTGWFRGDEVISMGPPSSGGLVLLQLLAILDGMPLDAERAQALAQRNIALEGEGAPAPAEASGLSALAVHWWIEGLRRAFADRAQHMGDPDQWTVPIDELLSPAWIAERRASIGTRSDPDVAAYVAAPAPESSETTHISVVDAEGNAVSLTTTLNSGFGSGILVAKAGFLLNNELDDFSIVPGIPNTYGLVGSEANQLQPGKRPLSSMTPTIVRDRGRRVKLVLGAPGGPRIITAVAQVLLRVLAYGQDLEEAVRAPRIHQQWKPTFTRMEAGWEGALLNSLRTVHGQELQVEREARFGSVQVIYVDNHQHAVGVSDPRRGGSVAYEGGRRTSATRPGDPVRDSFVRDPAAADGR